MDSQAAVQGLGNGRRVRLPPGSAGAVGLTGKAVEASGDG